jgi:hypothetical protein
MPVIAMPVIAMLVNAAHEPSVWTSRLGVHPYSRDFNQRAGWW